MNEYLEGMLSRALTQYARDCIDCSITPSFSYGYAVGVLNTLLIGQQITREEHAFFDDVIEGWTQFRRERGYVA